DIGVISELSARNIESSIAHRLLSMFRDMYTTTPESSEGSTELLNAARLESLRACSESIEFQDSVDDLARIVSLTSATPAAGYVLIDPRLARGLSYYTGPIMEVTVPDLDGSLGGGGRYDDLLATFGRNVPACGFSLGLERIIVVMTERNMFPAEVT